MELFERGNGVRVKRFGRPQALGSWDMYSIDGIRRGSSRPMRNYRLEMELRERTHTGFSDLTKMDQTRYPEITFWHILEYFWEICVL